MQNRFLSDEERAAIQRGYFEPWFKTAPPEALEALVDIFINDPNGASEVIDILSRSNTLYHLQAGNAQVDPFASTNESDH